MASQREHSTGTYTAAEAVGAFVRVKLSGTSDRTVAIAGVDERGIGLTQAAASAGDEVEVREWSAGGTHKMVAAAAIPTRNAAVYAAAAGRASATASAVLLGSALDTASAAGAVVEVLPDVRPQPAALVAASDSPAHARAAAAYLCDGTNDEVQIQAALDAASAAGGGTVELAAGNFSCAESAASLLKVSSGTTATLARDGADATAMILNVTAGEGAMYAAGDVVSISGGDNGGGKSLDTQEIAGIYTVASVATDAVTLCGPCEAGVTYTNVVYRLRSYSLKLPPLVHLFGAGIDVTNLILATNANCDMIQLSPPAKTSCMNHIRDMGLQGQLVSQNGAVGVSCGIVYGYNVMDFYLDHVFVDNFKGHGIVVNNGWGGVLTDMLIERCSQNGLFLCGGDSAAGSNGNMKVLNNKIMSNLMHQVVLQYFRRTHISFCEMDGNSGYASIKSAGSSLNRITSNLLYAHATGSAIFITGSILGPGADATITGNIFYGTGPAILCTLGEAAVASTSGVVVDGNDFGTASVDITATQGNIVFGRNGNYKNVVSGELKFLFHGVWDGAHAYIANDVVSSGAKLYRCKANTTNNEPPNATYWTQLGTSDDPAIIVLNHTMAVTPQWSWRTWMITPTSAQMALEHPFITDGTTTVTITFTGALTGVVGTPIPYWFLIEGTIASPRVNTVSAP